MKLSDFLEKWYLSLQFYLTLEIKASLCPQISISHSTLQMRSTIRKCADTQSRHPLQYSRASLVQLVKNPPAMWEIWVRSLG